MRIVSALALLICTALASASYALESGLQIGDPIQAFNPKHVAGPFKDLDVCTT